MNEHIKKWSEKLLDLSKRNSLISFKDTKNGVIDVVYPDIFQVFNNLILTEKNLEVYEDYICDEQLDENSEIISISKEQYVEIHQKNIKKNQVLLFKDKEISKKILKSIHKKNNEFFQEKGLTISHMCFGFVNWYESENSNIVYKTPILLAPITLENKSSINPFVIKKQDEVVLNQTFKYKLKVEYNIDLKEYDYDTSLDDYLEYVYSLIKRLKWSVTKEVKISNLPFSKINMYIDLKENENLVINNPVIKSIIDHIPPCYDGSEDEHTKHKNQSQLNVVSADSSQMEAIDLALKGRSFVLEGPPGTGKSQTITNMIAALLAQGKKVLFVSEKKAALDVVFNNLKKVDLEQFCIPLHGTKLNKKEFINDIYDTMSSGKKVLTEDVEDIIDSYAYLEINLDNYDEDLHKRFDGINLSLYELMGNLIKCEDILDVEYIINNIQNIDSKKLKDVSSNLENIKNDLLFFGLDFTKNYFYGVAYNELSYGFNIEFNKQLKAIEDITNDLLKYSFVKDFTNDRIVDITNSIKLYDILDEYSLINDENFLNKVSYYYNNAIELSDLSQEINELESTILKDFKKDVFEFDNDIINDKLLYEFSNPIKRFFSKKYKNIVKRFKLNSLSKQLKINYKNLLVYSEMLKKFNNLNRKYETTDQIKDLNISMYLKRNTNWDLLINNFNYIKDNNYLLSNAKVISNIPNKDYIEFEKNIFKINDLICNEKYYDTNLFNMTTLSIVKLNYKFKDIINNNSELSNWMLFLHHLNESKKLDLYEFILLIKDKNLDLNNLYKYYLKTYYLQWFDIMTKDTKLRYFNFEQQQKNVRNFKKTDDAIYRIYIDKIISKLSNNRPNLMNNVPGSSAAILSWEHEKKSKVKSILQLMNEIPQFIQEIKPCFLMSPLAVSTYINPQKVSFDVTIFDEASQIFPHDAVGAIYRSKQTIVVGDSKQMPPTNFFNIDYSVEESDDKDSDIDAFESILDLFKSSYPSKTLLWHYRSKVESLISFSNEKYYRNKLVTFPSTYLEEQYYGVDFHYVKNGIYSPNDRVNIPEANKVVDLIFENIKRYPNRSLGVIAFNKSQQEKIENLLEQRRRECKDFEEFFNDAVHEPFFIKNLETVQGDERDTIIFSICFGRDVNRVFRQNFGPLSRVGGERRLNVAVTRAKYNLQVVSSIIASDINISNVKNEGPQHLRTYLDYAQNGLVALGRELNLTKNVHFDSYFEEDVYDFLKSKGFEVETQVGCSNYKIDLALKEENSSNYYLAIECDGATYHSSKTARDRDKLRQSVLENMGWKFYRIWSTDWFKNNKSAKEKLLQYILDEKTNLANIEDSNAPLYSSKLSTKEDKVIAFKQYEFFDLGDINDLLVNSSNFNSIINDWIRFESPISVELILKKVCSNYGYEKVTQNLREHFIYNFEKDTDIILKDGYYYLEDKNNELRVFSNSKRQLELISEVELADGLYVILDSITQCNKENLFKYIIKELGYKSLTEKSKDILDKAFSLIEPYTILENDLYRVNKDIKFDSKIQNK